MQSQNKFGRYRISVRETLSNRELRKNYRVIPEVQEEITTPKTRKTSSTKSVKTSAKRTPSIKKEVAPKHEEFTDVITPEVVEKEVISQVVEVKQEVVPVAKEAIKTPAFELVKPKEEPVVTKVKTGSKTSKIEKIDLNELLKQRTEDRKPLVKIRNADVSFGFGKTKFKAVNGMNLNIYKGEVLGLVGESGSGKSTTGNAIANLVPISAGSIDVDGIKLRPGKDSLSKDERKHLIKTVQMIFQDPAASLNPYKNIFKVVSEGLDNIDVVATFIKQFDGETVNKVYDLAHSHTNQPESLKALSYKSVVEDIEKGYTEKIRRELYVNVQKDLAAMPDHWAQKTSEYLNSRLFERNKYFGKKKADKKRIKRKIVIDLLKSVGLSERILNRFPLEFSGGQQQRIGISRAIALNPKLLIADEPISALDVSIQAQVINILNDLRDSLGLTILFIAHDLRMVEYISDRIAIMYKGVLVEFGEASEVVNNPLHPYSKMLLDAVPSIDGKAGSLVGYIYDPRVHDYSKVSPSWHRVNGTEHYVLGQTEEISEWAKGNWPTVKKGDK